MVAMRLKSFLWVVSFALLLSSCIAKKKRSYSQAKKAYEKSSAQGSKSNALPDENTAGFTTYTFNSAEEYIRTFAPIALEEMEAYGIPASITLAQGLLESGAGSSNLVRKSNNHFGIKCHTKWRGPSTTHDDDEKGECFRKYLHPRESYRDHSLFLANGSRYAFLFNYRTTDYKAWARGLKKAGYATDPKYPAKLIAQIQKYNLDQYDHPRKAQRIIKENSENPISSYLSDRIHQVQKGDTLFGISKKYGLSVDTLKKINGLKSNDIQVGTSLKISIK